MNADDTELHFFDVEPQTTVMKQQYYYNEVMPPRDTVREVMKSNGALDLPLGGLACQCPKGEKDPQCCINKLGLK